MAASVLSASLRPESLVDVVRLVQPQSYADMATLGLLALGTMGALSRGKFWDKPDPYHHVWFEKPQEKESNGRAANKATRNIAQRLDETEKQVVIFWGSQSGTAEGFANRLARDFHLRLGIDALSADLSDFDPETISLLPESKIAIFIVSTFGEGDPSDNTAGTWDWIQRSTDTELPNLRYMAFGLGNSNYKYYNRVAEVLVEALEKFGAKSLMPTGKADDAEGATEEDFISWKESVFNFFIQNLAFAEREIKYEPTLSVVEDESLEKVDLHHGEPAHQRDRERSTSAASPIKALSVRNATELFSSKERNCLHLDLDLSNHAELHYKTGDHLAVWPTNPDAEVDRLLRVLGLTARKDVPLSIKSLDPVVKVRVPSPTSVSALFRYYLEICSPVSRDVILALAQFTTSSSAKQFFTSLGKDKAAYADYQTRNVVTLGHLLERAKEIGESWEQLPFSFLIETLPHVQPRYYSISSSSVTSPRLPSITAVVSTQNLQNNDSERVFGLTTNYLLALKQQLSEGSPLPHPHGLTYDLNGPSDALCNGKIYAHIRKSKFKLPVLASHLIVMVAAGSGIAPFRGFIAERARLKSMGKPVGRMILFFGCRRPGEDYIYRAELEEYQRELGGPETLEIIMAFSRMTEKKIYVQDRVAERADEVCELLTERNANFYICGSAAMAREVARSVTGAFSSRLGWSEDECKAWSDRQKRSNRWQEDVWG